MQALIMQAAGDMETLHKGVEDWFNHAMDQLSGDYKRFTGVVTFVIAFGLAIMFNIDALHVSQRLYTEPVLRKGTADAAAAQILKTDTLSQNFSQTEQALLVSEPVGWAGYKTWCDGHSASSWCAANGGLATLPARTWRLPTSWPYALMGWLVTALATMMGAPFWFDSLTRLVNLRNTGPKPKPSPDQ